MSGPENQLRWHQVRQVKTLLADLANARPWNERRKVEPIKPAIDKRTAEERLADAAREYGTKPVRLSAEVLGKLGITQTGEAWPGPSGPAEDDLRKVI